MKWKFLKWWYKKYVCLLKIYSIYFRQKITKYLEQKWAKLFNLIFLKLLICKNFSIIIQFMITYISQKNLQLLEIHILRVLYKKIVKLGEIIKKLNGFVLIDIIFQSLLLQQCLYYYIFIECNDILTIYTIAACR